jgi:hypothetical protein
VWRYLKKAFWARPEVSGLGRVPVNALLLAGFGILGFGHEAFWFMGAGLEAAYLAALVTNQRFRAWVDSLQLEAAAPGSFERQAILLTLSRARQDRHQKVHSTIEETFAYYCKSDVGEVLAETNRAALDQLSLFHLKLLAAEQSLDDLRASTNEKTLRNEIAYLRRELGSEKITPTLRISKEATLNILEKRLANLERRGQSLAEIEGDLQRIEAQVELARENAAMGSQPETVSANIQLASRMLDETSWSSPTVTQTHSLPSRSSDSQTQ